MSFHLYQINELYTNADGKVQFIELAVGPFNGESFFQGQSISATRAATTNFFTFPNDLPSIATANTTVLIATKGFADLGIVAPDFIVPDGFLFISGGAINFAGVDVVNYSLLPTDGLLSVNRSGTTAANSPKNFAGVSGTITGNVISGTDGPDDLVGTTGSDVMLAGAGNDRLNGLEGDDQLDGGPGTDTALYAGNRVSYVITGSVDAGFSVAGLEGNDLLAGIERFDFADRNLAFDLAAGQPAGNTVRIIGAAFDANNIIPEFVAIGLQLFDSGWTMLDVCQLAIETPLFLSLAGSSSDVDFVNLVYRNVVGVAPPAAERDFYVGLLQGSGASMTRAQLLMLAADASINGVNIDLIGLSQSGVEFAG